MQWLLVLIACGGSEPELAPAPVPAAVERPVPTRPAVEEVVEEVAEEVAGEVAEEVVEGGGAAVVGNPGRGGVGKAQPKQRETAADDGGSTNTVGKAQPKERESEEEKEMVREGGDETQIKK